MSRFVTVVFEINDEDSFKGKRDELHKKMLAGDDAGWRVSAMSLSDEMTRLDLIEQARNKDDALYVIDDIFSAVNINGKTIDDFAV